MSLEGTDGVQYCGMENLTEPENLVVSKTKELPKRTWISQWW
jgi:hypothetical protein